MYCAKCGAKNEDGALFCMQCGSRLTAAESKANERSDEAEEAIIPPNRRERGNKRQGLYGKPKRRRSFVLPIILCAVVLIGALAVFFILRGLGSSYEVGDTLEFGTYEQDNNTENGKEPIEWVVLAVEDDRLLVISKYCLDCQPYNTEDADVTWEISTLRSWLNSDFMAEAFSDSEKKEILLTGIENPGLYIGVDENGSWITTNTAENLETILYQTDDGDPTEDSVFLLSADEQSEYLNSSEYRDAAMTDYAKELFIEDGIAQAEANGVTDEDTVRERYREYEEEYGEGYCYWWLRSPGVGQDSAAVMDCAHVQPSVQYVSETGAVRPAMWISD